MTTIITGGRGRLGKYVAKEIPNAIIPSHTELDVTNRQAVFEFFAKHKPDTVIHLAALVDVRESQNNNEKAWKVNVGGTENVVDAAFAVNPKCYFIYISSACVFNGERGGYTEEDVPNPVNYYGLTKAVAEEAVKKLPNHLIIRTDFVERAKWRYPGAYVDRFSTCVFSDTLAKALKGVIDKKVTGLIHLTGKRKISHYDLAKITTPEVQPIKLKDADIPMPRDQSIKSIKGWDNLEL